MVNLITEYQSINSFLPAASAVEGIALWCNMLFSLVTGRLRMPSRRSKWCRFV
jgi:hypothetical protein